MKKFCSCGDIMKKPMKMSPKKVSGLKMSNGGLYGTKSGADMKKITKPKKK
jgi:hypothetical protein